MAVWRKGRDQKRQRVNCEPKIPPAPRLRHSLRSVPIPNHHLYLQIVKNGRETLKICRQRAERRAAAALIAMCPTFISRPTLEIYVLTSNGSWGRKHEHECKCNWPFLWARHTFKMEFGRISIIRLCSVYQKHYSGITPPKKDNVQDK